MQKPLDDRWRKEIAAIYAVYEPYYQSGGIEQAVFDRLHGMLRCRSAVVLDQLATVTNVATSGSLLDVGCGNGVLLKAFSRFRPSWRLFGYDLSETNLTTLNEIPGFEKLYTTSLDQVPDSYDLITMSHSLEHFIDPVEGLRAIKSKLLSAGALLVQVPNAEETPFDLLVADHVSHFTAADLARAADAAGFAGATIAYDWVAKELSMVAGAMFAGLGVPKAPNPRQATARVRAQVAWLHAVIAEVEELTAGGRRIGLLGTSVAAMWLFGPFADRIAFFVDEDPSRRGTTLLDRPVLAPEAVPVGETVFVALAPVVANAITSRLGHLPIRFAQPAKLQIA